MCNQSYSWKIIDYFTYKQIKKVLPILCEFFHILLWQWVSYRSNIAYYKHVGFTPKCIFKRKVYKEDNYFSFASNINKKWNWNRVHLINVIFSGGSKISTLNKVLLSQGVDLDRLWHAIDQVIVKTIISAWPILKHSYHACFPSHDMVSLLAF